MEPGPGEAGPLGIVAGGGAFPGMVIEGARRAGRPVSVIALRGLADAGLASRADRFRWSGLARLGRWIRLFRRDRVREVILAGSVRKSSMYGRWRLLRLIPDWTTLRIWFFQLPDKRNDTVLAAVADELAHHGMRMRPCVDYCSEHLAPEGALTRRTLTPSQERDAEFGWRIAKEMGRLDVGQAIAVKETEVIAVEAIEGTDRMIERAGALCPRGGWILIKTAKPNQDMRFDVPTVGPETIVALRRAGAAALVIEAGKTLIVDRAQLIRGAEEGGIVVVALGDRSFKSPSPTEAITPESNQARG